jgi:hypothetical protein
MDETYVRKDLPNDTAARPRDEFLVSTQMTQEAWTGTSIHMYGVL